MKKLKGGNKEEFPLDLTHDLVVDILSKLDVKTLFRLKCVSRTWLNIISDPLFVNTHRQQSMKNMKYLSLSTCVCPEDEYRSILSFYLICGQNYRWSKLSNFTLMYDNICPIACDIVCFKNYNNIYLCNPSTLEICVLPKPSTSLYCTTLGFGYSAQVMEYKVVRLFPNSSRCHKRSKTEVDTKIKGMRCEILTISDDTKVDSCSWKSLRCPRGVYPRAMSANGRIYWLIDHKASLHTLRTEELILSFDIATDTFSILPRPPGWPLEGYKNALVFMVMDGMLCITDKRSMQKNAILDIWMLKENYLWTKVYSINLLEYSYNGTTLSPWVIRNLHPECMIGGEIVFEPGSRIEHLMEGRFSCNIESKTLHKIAFPLRLWNIGTFWESLFRLK